MFDSDAQERLGCYVYALFDPDEPHWPFYIGKGSGNRVFSHAAGQLLEDERTSEQLSAKAEQIADIKRGGKDVIQKIIRYDLSDEEALRVEASLIDLVNYIRPETLKNLVSGHGVAEGLIDAVDLATALNAPVLETAIPVVLIKIEQQWSKLLSTYGAAHKVPSSDIFRAVSGDWRISVSRAMRANCVLAVARGIVRGAYIANNWFDVGNEGRKRFEGVPASEPLDAFVGKSVTGYFQRGGQNPIRYLNF